ncbi:hypothetical protein KGY79_11625 [Candidatus Bipolaricaulota bacterium]|nr:hypothetical protein [Candidatus Bipolaricaulota bacterium]
MRAFLLACLVSGLFFVLSQGYPAWFGVGFLTSLGLILISIVAINWNKVKLDEWIKKNLQLDSITPRGSTPRKFIQIAIILLSFVAIPWVALILEPEISLKIGSLSGVLLIALPVIIFVLFLLYIEGLMVDLNTRVIENAITPLYNLAQGKMQVDYYYSDYTFYYLIDGEGKQDKFSREFSVHAEEDEILVLKTMKFGKRGEESDMAQEFEDLEIKESTNKGDLLVYESDRREEESDSNHWIGTCIFTDPIIPNELPKREATVSGNWPNLWGGLREKGYDEGAVTPDKLVKNLEVVIVFPRDVEEAKIIDHDPEIEVETDSDSRNRLQKILTIKEAQKDKKYEYDVKCKKLPELIDNPGS